AAATGAADHPLPDVGANHPIETAHIQHELSAAPQHHGGGGGGGGGRPHPQQPLSEAQQRMADLQKKADWKSEMVFHEQLAKAESLGNAAETKQAQIESYSAVEEEKQKAKQKKAQADAEAHVDAEKGKQKVTIESLKADLAKSIETEKQELTQQ